MSDRLSDVLAHIDSDIDNSLERLFRLIEIQSISTDPAFAGACLQAAEWLADALKGVGFDAGVRPTPGHPMVVGHAKEGAGPHVLFYGHYDVQPVDPIDLWETDPFAPRIVTAADGSKQIVARGSSDDKGQLMTFIEACRAWKAVTGKLPIPVSILLEGEEESGGPSLVPFMKANKDELTADFAFVCDTGMWDKQTPAVTTMLRGLVGEEITITAAKRDLHSGMYGGAARNPIHVLVSILDGLRDENGRITLPGFYDGVGELPPAIKAQWDALGFDSAKFLGDVGLSIPAGEIDRSVLEKIWARPTCEVNGISGGYTGKGFKTVIPSQAFAKISFRLVDKQDPDKIRAAFRDYVRSKLPADCSVEFSPHGGSPGIRLPGDLPALVKTRQALTEEWGRDCVTIGSGGSIPVAGDFQSVLGMDALMVGFALDDDRIHSPNEKYDVSSYHGGIRSWARILAALSEKAQS
ncbi:M20/M25/M40 family metallo-hydrolase [Kaistia dalseonensis]|uniref:Acetylornithine deacetylase/succinyl-diaminopimelate desuccinylase-like protein n=1 Tax=Kaistia dalseonensis TaxID=410840 RepID=A0ABU0HFD9_9HYPH|nr:M20/M25/M40 family metallo-hydrolase [Kaistia dalseonensis]MCX5497591.1 M20/M25/M40 family metallo-hydrolase [Kaistia dalseonensis]MDQ0440231.1 acetylornithine deacetylase/succinyl-diaminopimelate desuccinylase-like protein [Kaistia dalseonensis]